MSRNSTLNKVSPEPGETTTYPVQCGGCGKLLYEGNDGFALRQAQLLHYQESPTCRPKEAAA